MEDLKSFLKGCVADGNESPQVDFKLGYTGSMPQVAAQIAKHICAMANFEANEYDGRCFLILGTDGDSKIISGGMDSYISTDSLRASFENSIKSFLHPKPRIEVRAFLNDIGSFWGAVILNSVYPHNLPYSMANDAPWSKTDEKLGKKHFHKGEIFIRDGQTSRRANVPDDLDDIYERKRYSRLPKPLLIAEPGQPIRAIKIERPFYVASDQGRTSPFNRSDFDVRGFAYDKSSQLIDPNNFRTNFENFVYKINYGIWINWSLRNENPRSARGVNIDFHFEKAHEIMNEPFYFKREASPWHKSRQPSMKETQPSIINNILHKGFWLELLSKNRIEPLIEFGFFVVGNGRQAVEITAAFEIKTHDGFLSYGHFPINLTFTEDREVNELELIGIDYRTYSKITYE